MTDSTAATEATDSPPVFNPLAPGYFEDPYTQYRAVRESDPVHRSLFDAWALFRHEDAFELLRNPATSVAESETGDTARRRAAERAGIERDGRASSLLFLDPPDHTRIRGLVSKAFTPRTVENLRPRVAELVDGMLDDIAEAGTVNLMDELAFPLPFTVISDLLGMPAENRAELRTWSSAGAQGLEPLNDDETADEILESIMQMVAFVTEVIDHKRDHPDDALLSRLIEVEDEGERLSHEELLSLVILLYIAGHETTVNLIGNGTRALLDHPDQAAIWRADPDLDVGATDELLRWDSPVQFSRRILTADATIGGVDMAAGEFVFTVLGSANRDPDQWGPTAEQLDVTRENTSRHLSFGSGIHFCLGAALARMEGQETIGRLIRRFPDMELAASPVQRPRMVLRGLESLMVSV